jgi:hypothetical protein
MEVKLERSEALDDRSHIARFGQLADAYAWQGRDHHCRSQVNWWGERFGNRILADIKPEDV